MSALVPYYNTRLQNRIQRNNFGALYRRWNSLSARARNGFRQRSNRSFTLAQRRGVKYPTSGVGVTTQHDQRRVYTKRRMPRRMKRRWRKFSKKVLAISEKDLGTQQVMFNKQVNASNNLAGNQTIFSCALYGLRSATASHFNDLQQIATYNANAATTSSTGLFVGESTKILFQSAILDLTIRNGSTFFDGTTTGPSPYARMEVDVYELTMRHTAEEQGAAYDTIDSIFNQNQQRTLPIGGGATSEIIYDRRGVTPFELSYALSRFGIKIWKKTKYQISNGDQITYQMRDPRRHSVVQREMQNQDGFNKPGLTKILYVTGKLAPGLTVGNTANTFQEALNIGITRKYMYKIENWTEDRTAFDTL